MGKVRFVRLSEEDREALSGYLIFSVGSLRPTTGSPAPSRAALTPSEGNSPPARERPAPDGTTRCGGCLGVVGGSVVMSTGDLAAQGRPFRRGYDARRRVGGRGAALTARQEIFCREYLIDLNASAAAPRHG